MVSSKAAMVVVATTMADLLFWDVLQLNALVALLNGALLVPWSSERNNWDHSYWLSVPALLALQVRAPRGD